MALDAVSDVLAFVCKHPEFTKAILFAEDDVPEIRPEEQKAITAVMGHVRESYVKLLGACRDEWVERATDPSLRKTLERNWNRDDSIWDRRSVELPLLIQASYVEGISFRIDEEPTRRGAMSLFATLWVQVRRNGPLLEVAAGDIAPAFLTEREHLRVVTPIAEGKKFVYLAREVVEPLWPLAIDIRQALLDQKIEKKKESVVVK